jgi:hypothetical protein
MDEHDLSDRGRAIARRITEELEKRAPMPVTAPAAPQIDSPLVQVTAPLSPSYFAELARAMGADVETTAPEDYRPRCSCGRPMARRNEICTGCSYERRFIRWRETIHDAIAPAASSFDPTGKMAWVRAGHPRYDTAVKQGLTYAQRMARSHERDLALRLFGEALWMPTDGNVLLLGTTGHGKTMATMAVGHRLIDEATRANPIARSEDHAEQERARRDTERVKLGVGVRFTTADAMADEAMHHPFGRGTPPLFAAAQQATMVVIDEVGRCRVDAIRKLLFDRYLADCAPVIMTGSVTLAEFKAWIGMDGFRRIEERGYVIDLPRSTW